MKSVTILLVAILLCPAFALAVEEAPVAVEETVAVAEDAKTGDVVGEAVEVDELYAPATAKEEANDIKAEAKEEIKEVKAEAKAEVKEIKAEEKEALKEAKM